MKSAIPELIAKYEISLLQERMEYLTIINNDFKKVVKKLDRLGELVDKQTLGQLIHIEREEMAKLEEFTEWLESINYQNMNYR